MGQAIDSCSVCQSAAKAKISALGGQRALEKERPPRPDFGVPTVFGLAGAGPEGHLVAGVISGEDTDAAPDLVLEASKSAPASGRRTPKGRRPSKGTDATPRCVEPPMTPSGSDGRVAKDHGADCTDVAVERAKSPLRSDRRISKGRADDAGDGTDSSPLLLERVVSPPPRRHRRPSKGCPSDGVDSSPLLLERGESPPPPHPPRGDRAPSRTPRLSERAKSPLPIDHRTPKGAWGDGTESAPPVLERAESPPLSDRRFSKGRRGSTPPPLLERDKSPPLSDRRFVSAPPVLEPSRTPPGSGRRPSVPEATKISSSASAARCVACPQGTSCRRQRDAEHLAHAAHPFDAEYSEVCRSSGMEPEVPSLRGLFEWVDVDDSGKISLKELESAMPLLENLFGEPLHLSKKAWEHLDEDGNGCVNFSEFAAWAGPRLGLPLGVKHLFKACSVMGCPCAKFECKPRKKRFGVAQSRLQLCRCGHKRCSHDEGVNSRMEVPHPDYWTSREKDVSVLVPVDVSSLKMFQQIFDQTHRNIWTRDRKRHNPDAPNVPKGYQVVRAWRSENSKYWQEYSVRRAELSKSRDDIGREDDFVEYSDLKSVKAWQKCAGSAGDRLRRECNEWYLFHGTTPEAAKRICDGDFKINLAGSSTGTLYGRGCYFSESITKADEYAKADSDGNRALILCRALGGRVRYTDELEPDAEELTESCIQGPYDCILGDREKCRNTFREFVFYDTENIYAEYVIHYKRIY